MSLPAPPEWWRCPLGTTSCSASGAGDIQGCFKVESEDGFSSAAVKTRCNLQSILLYWKLRRGVLSADMAERVLEVRSPALWVHWWFKRVSIKPPTSSELHQSQWDQLMTLRGCSDCQMASCPSVASVLVPFPPWWPFPLPQGLFNLISTPNKSGGSCRH